MLIHLTRVWCSLFKFFSSYQVLHLISTGVVSTSILSLKHFFLAVFLVPCPTEYFISFISMVFFLSSCSTSQGSLVPLVCQRSNFVLPPPLPFLSGAILDLGTRSSCSCGVL